MTANPIQLTLLIDQEESLPFARSAGVSIALPAEAPTEWFARAKDLKVPVAVLIMADGDGSSTLASADDELRNQAIHRVEQSLHQAARCGARLVTVSPECNRTTTSRAQDYAEALHKTLLSLRSLSLSAATTGVRVGIKVASGGFLLSPAEARNLLETVGRPEITISLDVHEVASTSCPLDWIRTLRHRLGCVFCRASDLSQLSPFISCLAEVGFSGPLACRTEAASAGDGLAELALKIEASSQAQ